MAIPGKFKTFLNMLMIAVMIAASVPLVTVESSAETGLEAAARVKSVGGAVLRSKPSTKGTRLAVLNNGAVVEVYQEIFTTAVKYGRKYKWYYVNTGAGKGYIRSDLVKIKKYGSAKGVLKKDSAYRYGAGIRMKKKGVLEKDKTVTIVMEAKASDTDTIWYRIKKGTKYYYVKKSRVTVSNVTTGLPATDPDSAALTVTQSSSALKVVNGAVSWGIKIAGDNRFHYGKKPNSQHNGCYFCGTQKTSGGRSKKGVKNYQYTYCCNPFVHACFAHGGNEKTMLQICKKGSSYDYKKGKGYDVSPLFAKLGKPDMSLLKKGDVLCTHNHVMLYIGNGKIVEATGGDDNVVNSKKWNNSIRVCTLAASKYAKVQRVYRYIGDDQ